MNRSKELLFDKSMNIKHIMKLLLDEIDTCSKKSSNYALLLYLLIPLINDHHFHNITKIERKQGNISPGGFVCVQR